MVEFPIVFRAIQFHWFLWKGGGGKGREIGAKRVIRDLSFSDPEFSNISAVTLDVAI
jgi:hypothetical protein